MIRADDVGAGAGWSDALYLSTNGTFDKGDLQLGEDDHDGPVAASDRYNSGAFDDLAVLAENPGEVGFLVWGDPAFYDSTIRVVDQIADAVAAGEPSGSA